MSDEKEAIAQNISLLLSQNRSADARVELDRLLLLDPEDPESRSLAGDVYAWTGAQGAAYKQYNLAADAFNRLGRSDKALGVHHKILDLDTSMMDAGTQARIRLLTLLVGAEDALVVGQNDKAVAGYTEAIRQFPNHTITYQRLATLLVRLGRLAEAVEQYLTVARAFYAHGVLPKARPYFERVLELRPDQAEALEAVLVCLKAEDKEAEGARFMKAAVQGALEQGRNEDAAAWFERLPEASRDGATPLGAALLLQSGEVGQAERMVAQLDLDKPEIAEWFKRLGRAALDRGDSLSADVFFRWGLGQVEAPAAPIPEVAPPLPPPLPGTPVPVLPVAVQEPVAAPSPPMPVLAASPPVLAAPLGMGPPPRPLPAAVLAPPQPKAAASELEGSPVESQDDRAILQTMGEMCLAEEMYEEGKQVFERLTRLEPSRAQYWELLNRARAGLGLTAVAVPASSPAQAPVAPQIPQPEPIAAMEVPALAVLPPAPVQVQAEMAVTVEATPLPVEEAVARVAEPSEVGLEAVAVPMVPPPLPPMAAVLAPPALPMLPPLPPLQASFPPLAALPLFEAAVAAPAVQEAASEAEAPVPSSSAQEEGRPQLEAIGLRTHTPAKVESGIERPAVEWGDAPLVQTPPEPITLAPPLSLPPPPKLPPLIPRPPVPERPSRIEARQEETVAELVTASSGPSKIVHTAFVVQLGELPPAVPSAVDYEDDLIG